MSSVILGIDPGSRVCGYGVIRVERGRCYYIECGVLTANPKAEPAARLADIARSLAEVIEELAPTCVAVEDVFTRRNHRSAIVLAQARGSVLAVAGMAGLPVHAYPATLVKKCVTGFGRASKEQVARMVQTLIGLRSLPTADATDALAVAIAHASSVRP